jgi:hypothetical protein
VFQRFLQVVFSFAALLAVLLNPAPTAGHHGFASWPVYLAGSIVLAFEAFRPTLLKGRFVWIVMTLATFAATGFGLLVRGSDACCDFGLGYPYMWVFNRDGTWPVNVYLLGFDLLFWLCATAAAIGLISGIRHLLTKRVARSELADIDH